MNRAVLIGLAALVLGAVVLLLIELRSTPDRPSVPAAATPTPAARPTPPPRPRAIRKPVVDQDPESEGEAVEPAAELSSHERSLLLSGDVPQRLMLAAATCYRDEPGKFEKMEVSFTLRFRSGKASLHDVRYEGSEINAPRLETCVVDTLKTLTWVDRDAPDLEEPMRQKFSILDLRKRAPKRPDADEPAEPNDDF